MYAVRCLQDYVVALPQEYYEAYQLQEKVTKPCQVNGANSLCNQFSYLSTKKPGLFTTELETGYIIQRPNGRSDTQLFKNESVQEQLDLGAMALLDNNQVRNTVTYSLTSHPGDLDLTPTPPYLTSTKLLQPTLQELDFSTMAVLDNSQV